MPHAILYQPSCNKRNLGDALFSREKFFVKHNLICTLDQASDVVFRKWDYTHIIYTAGGGGDNTFKLPQTNDSDSEKVISINISAMCAKMILHLFPTALLLPTKKFVILKTEIQIQNKNYPPMHLI